eukprot:CAMPEP_0182867122 /NCGR_PEP_ID=MMETSP0034_2-20130328/8549_1 /TAXON_ID=156128 /ORGANISM="Nephroselmis pyriformis, Strain CCMP717" /LENGTH=650 /DNA_ID=CAMNT_0024999461 /DNA_START=8 /DNA_END=1960 /DNA_ORIENTATION=-
MEARDAVQQALDSHLAGHEDMDPAIVEYVTDMATNILEDGGPKAPKDELVEELVDGVGPLIEGLDEDAVAKLCDAMAGAYVGAGEVDTGPKKDYLIDCENIILAFAGRTLLSRCALKIERGHRYGLVGQNGVGKTTFLTRIAAKDIGNFPQDLVCLYIKHEVMAEREESVLHYIQTSLEGAEGDSTGMSIDEALDSVGFDDKMRSMSVSELSGGWRMRLAVACALLQSADLLMLDEPTNHMDTQGVQWLTNYLANLTGTTVIIVSHDADFLGAVATDVVHMLDKGLHYYAGGWSEFMRERPDFKDNMQQWGYQMHAADRAMKGAVENYVFPDPGPLDGVKNRNKVIMHLKRIGYQYEGTGKVIIRDVNVKLALNSRVAVVGKNGAGKSTMLKLLVGELQPIPGVGEVYKHHNLRLAYIAQHSMHHVEGSLTKSPMEYIQLRYQTGTDKEAFQKNTVQLTPEEEAIRAEPGRVEAIVGRRGDSKQRLEYEVKKTGRRTEENTWEPLLFLQNGPSYVMKLVNQYDEILQAQNSGIQVRPLLSGEILKHLSEFGLNEELARGKIKNMSGGQRSRLVLAAAMWNRPHVLAMDEPTNYLDREALDGLVEALKTFKGGMLIVSHNSEFVSKMCNEYWSVENGKLTVTEHKEKLMKD